MAFFDNPAFIISHIQNSFVTGDDTGLSELVIVHEDASRKKLLSSLTGSVPASVVDGNVTNNSDLAFSYDITAEMSLDMRQRPRSNTAYKLERMKQDRLVKSKIKVIHWKDGFDHLSDSELDELFAKKTIIKKDASKRTLLSEQLEKFPNAEGSRFSEYTKYDGNTHIDVGTKKISIFMTMLSSDKRGYPLPVCVVSSAKVQDLIGLTLWLASQKFSEYEFRDRDYYTLHIAEDDGEPDLDFPALDNKEVISKFGFTTLALVEKEQPTEADKALHIVRVVVGSGFNTFPVESLDVTLGSIFDQVMKRRKGMVKADGLSYVLEKQDNPGVPVDLESTLESQGTLNFSLRRENSSPFPSATVYRSEDDDSEPVKYAQEPDRPFSSVLQYQSFQKIYALHKLWTNSEVHLGISAFQIDIDPSSHRSTFNKVRPKQKPTTLKMGIVASCHILEEKTSTGRSSFRLAYKSGNDFKYHDFETDMPTAKLVCQKVSKILEMRGSTNYNEFHSSVKSKPRPKRTSNIFQHSAPNSLK